jgi:hypothetical protein
MMETLARSEPEPEKLMRQATLDSTTLPSKQEDRARAPMGYWLSILMLCLLPLERWMLPLNLRIVDFALVLLILYSLAKVRFMEGHFRLPLIAPMWLILVASFIAILGSMHLESVMAIIQEVYLFVWFLCLTNVLAALPLSSLDRLMKLWSVIAVAEAAASLMGMWSIGPSLFYTSPIGGEVLSSNGLNRALGTYLNPNATAAYLSISFFVLWATSWSVRVRLPLGLWLLAGIFATGSLGALASTIASFAILVMLFLSHKHYQAAAFWRSAFSIGIGVGIALLLYFNLWYSFAPTSRFVTESDLFSLSAGRMSRSLSGRSDLVEGAWRTYWQHPLGTGPNTAAEYIGGDLHNDYVAFMFERGPLGALGWLWLVGSTLLVPLRVANEHSDSSGRWLVLALGAGFLACAVNALSHEVSHFRQVWVLMAFIFAASSILSARAQSGETQSQIQKGGSRWLSGLRSES